MAECEVCGRTLKTGRKYCYEHRNSGYNDSIGSRILNDAERSFIRYKSKRYSSWLGISLFISAFLLILGLGYPSKGLIGLALTLVFMSVYFFRASMKGIREKIILRNPEYISWAKDYVKMHREEQAFKKSLLE